MYAHRGDRSRAPDNTLEAYQLAVDAGADGIELDVRRTSDGELIMSHDDRYPGFAPFVEMTLAEIRDALPHVPTFIETLAAVPRNVWLNVEIKNFPDEADFDTSGWVVDKTIETIDACDDAARILLSSFDRESVRRAAAANPNLLRGQLIRAPFDIDTGVDVAVEVSAHALHPNMGYFGVAAKETAARIKRAGLAIVVWGANTPDEVQLLLESEVDVIITDDPTMARRVVDQR
ncbi:MAG: glycerophosphodiester phosphodiesterase [Acidimicrobiia bacterium]|nr:MAG: glycerophosphodiester phosphodiesterase [Acidimicrobiia bacterium]